MSVPHGVLYLNQQESNVMAGFLSPPRLEGHSGRTVPPENDRGVLAGEVEGKY